MLYISLSLFITQLVIYTNAANLGKPNDIGGSWSGMYNHIAMYMYIVQNSGNDYERLSNFLL